MAKEQQHKTRPRNKKADVGIDDIREAMGIPLPRALDLASGMRCDVGRLGYPDEGLRLTFSIGSPYDFHSEVQLSRSDAMWLRDRLTAALDDPQNANMPHGGARPPDAD